MLILIVLGRPIQPQPIAPGGRQCEPAYSVTVGLSRDAVIVPESVPEGRIAGPQSRLAA